MPDRQPHAEGEQVHHEAATDSESSAVPRTSRSAGNSTSMRARFWTRWIILVIAIVGGLVWWTIDREPESSTATTAVGDSVIQQYELVDRFRIGEYSGDLLDGGSIQSSDFTGRVTVYNVWGSWCVPCRTEAPDLVRLAGESGDEVAFLGINVRDSEAAARAFEREFEVPYPSITTGTNSAVILALGSAAGAAVPTTILVDGEGRIAARVVGPGTYTTFRTLLDDVLAENAESKR